MSRIRARGWIGDRRGVVALEFALIAPFLIALLFGLFEVASLVRVSFKLSHSANSLAKVIAQQVDDPTTGIAVTTTTLADYCKGAGYVLTPFSTGKLAASIVSVTAATTTNANGTQTTAPAKDWEDDTACASAGSAYAATAVTMAGSGSSGYNLTPSSGNSAIIVRTSYVYTPLLHYLLGSSWTLSQVAFARPRQGTTVTCSGC